MTSVSEVAAGRSDLAPVAETFGIKARTLRVIILFACTFVASRARY